MTIKDEINAPINVNPVGGGGGGVRARGGDLTNFKIFFIKFPRVGNERSIKSVKKPPPQGKKSKKTILILYKRIKRTFQKYVLTKRKLR